jgi:RND family efflux transporter MFP subunit
MTQYFEQGTPFNVQLQADPKVTGQGTVREVAPQADAQTRTRRVRIALDNPPEGFRLGATIRAAKAAPEQNLVTIPIQALLDENGKTSIWVIDPHKQTVSLHDVQVTERRGNSFVAGGVDVGSYVAIAGVHELKEGQKVRLDEKGAGL